MIIHLFKYFHRSSRVKAILIDRMTDGVMPTLESLDRFGNYIKAMLPAIDSVSEKAMALVNMNRTVHLPTYNKIIAEAARELSGKGDGAA